MSNVHPPPLPLSYCAQLGLLCGSVGLPSVIPHPAPTNRPGTFPLLCASLWKGLLTPVPRQNYSAQLAYFFETHSYPQIYVSWSTTPSLTSLDHYLLL
jgi:hypothetical protein